MVVAETRQEVFTCKLRLDDPGLFKPQIVEAKVRGNMRLVVSPKIRPRRSDASPFGKSLSPPGIVFGNGMELRQIERDRTRTRAFTRGKGASPIGLCWVYVQTLVFRSYLKLNYSKPNLNCWMRSGTKDLTDHRERRSRTPQKEGEMKQVSTGPFQRSRLIVQVAFCLYIRYPSHLSSVVNRIRTARFERILN